ncbi:unnamed protein product [Cochlearia groenlandica]
MSASPANSKPLHGFSSLPRGTQVSATETKSESKSETIASQSAVTASFSTRTVASRSSRQPRLSFASFAPSRRSDSTDEIPIPTQREEREKSEKEEEEAEGKRTWNLRTRKAFKGNGVIATTEACGGGGATEAKNQKQGGGSEPRSNRQRGIPAESAGGFDSTKENHHRRLWVALSRDEIEEDVFSMSGSRPSRRPRKRTKTLQKYLDVLFPGLCLVGMNADCFKVSDSPVKDTLNPYLRRLLALLEHMGSRSKETREHEPLKLPLRPSRDRPPTSYSIRFESFTTMMDLVKDGYYESLPFNVGGFNWTFHIYPTGNKEDTPFEWVSLYAKIDKSSLIDQQDVYAEIKFFAYDYSAKNYSYIQETEPVMFNSYKPKWGVPLFIPTWAFKPPFQYSSNGGQSEFGIDIFIAQPFSKWEEFSYDENIIDPIFAWNIDHFSTLSDDSYTSDPFSSGGRNWVLKVYPKGNGDGTGNSLSIYLLSESSEKQYVRAKLRVLNQIPSNQVEKLVEGWPNAAENGWGYDNFIPLSDLNDETKGFVVDDLLKVEVEIMAFSKTDSN